MANTVKDFATPDGPILLLSAKGLTTASIAEANGVKDFSGNGNHGQAFGGVTVLDGGEGFAFDGTNGRIMILRNFGISNTRFCTMSIRFKMTNNPSSSVIAWFGPSNETRAIIGVFTSNNIFYINVNKNERAINNFYPLLNKEYHLVVVADDSKARLYVDGEMIQELEIVYTEYVAGRLGIGARINDTTASSFSYPFCGNIRDFHIYPRALSAAEVKYLYNGFQPNIIVGQAIPSGAILDLSARGLTTAGIAQANGVVDRSGNGNHGQAYNGVAVVNDDEMGSCFSFDGTGYTTISSVDLRNATAVTLHCNVAPQEITRDGYLFFSNRSTNCWSFFCDNHPNYGLGFEFYNSFNQRTQIISRIPTEADAGKWITLTATVDNVNKLVVLYEDGIEVGRTSTNGTVRINNNYTIAVGTYLVNNTIYRLLGKMASVRIYPRALTASEVQQLADASLKKIRGVNMGSTLIKHIYYGSNLIYAKIDNYEAVPSEVTFKLHQLTSTTQRNTIEYAGSNINYRSITYSNGAVNMGNWSDWINAHFTPVMLKSDGTVDYELNRDNLNYKSDGSTPSDIANTSYDGNAMLQIKKFYISSSTTVEDEHTVFTFKLSDTKKDSSYTCWGFVNDQGEEQPYAYYGLFHGYIDNNSKLRSMSGITLSNYTHTSTFSTMSTAAQANGSGWDISNYPLENAIGLVLMMLYKDVNPMFINQDSSDNYREYSITPYATTGALAASGGFPWITTSMMQKALWIECYWRNAAISNLAASVWINGLGALRNSSNPSGFGIYYKLKGPYNDYSTPANWTYMANTIPYVYSSNSHQIETATIYDNMLFPESRGDNAIGGGGGIIDAYYNRFYGGGDVNGSSSSYHSSTILSPMKTGMYRALDKYAAPPHYMSYQAFGSDSQTHKKNGSARLTYLKSSS